MPDLYSIVGPLLRCLDPEAAHNLTLRALELGLAGRTARIDRPLLKTSCLGLSFPNPIGLAAGFDKDARVPNRMLALGFGFVEIGTVTPKPQSGNPKPRIFRLIEDRAVINRLGFNNQGMDASAQRLSRRDRSAGLLGVNIGKNKTSDDAVADYVAAFNRLAHYADYFVINVSSPNTPGLRDLQAVESLRPLLDAMVRSREKLGSGSSKTRLLLKLAPDLTVEEVVAAAELAHDSGFDGLTISNTTLGRPDSLKSPFREEAGGLSGQPLEKKSTELVRSVYRATNGALPIVGVGGVSNADDAFNKIAAGASLVQLYSGLVFEGPALVSGILDGLEATLQAKGFSKVADAVGSEA